MSTTPELPTADEFRRLGLCSNAVDATVYRILQLAKENALRNKPKFTWKCTMYEDEYIARIRHRLEELGFKCEFTTIPYYDTLRKFLDISWD